MLEGMAAKHALTAIHLEELEYLAGVDARAATGASRVPGARPGEPPDSGKLDGSVAQVAASWAERPGQDAV